MDQSTLVLEGLEAGRAVVEAIRDAGIPVTAAFWSVVPESEDWRLNIATDLFHTLGPLQTYGRFNEVLRPMPEWSLLSLSDLKAVSPNDPLVKAVQSYRHFRGGRPLRVAGAFHDGTYVEGVYIYPPRAEPTIAATPS